MFLKTVELNPGDAVRIVDEEGVDHSGVVLSSSLFGTQVVTNDAEGNPLIHTVDPLFTQQLFAKTDISSIVIKNFMMDDLASLGEFLKLSPEQVYELQSFWNESHQVHKIETYLNSFFRDRAFRAQLDHDGSNDFMWLGMVAFNSPEQKQQSDMLDYHTR